MQNWETNSANHDFDIWLKQSGSNTLVRQREYDLYFSDIPCINSEHKWVTIPNMNLDTLKSIHTSLYNVGEWIDCPGLLNNPIRIEINIHDIDKIRQGCTDTDLHRQVALKCKELPFPWFIRTCSGSPKDAINIDRSTGQSMCSFWDIHAALYAISISSRCYEPIKQGYSKHIWISKYTNIEDYIHYRVFVRNNKVTVISQYDQEEPPQNPLSVKEKILDLWNNAQTEVWYQDCVMDIIHNEVTNEGYIIEFNEFGASSLAGSALYNWVQDFHLLYLGDSDMRLNPISLF